VPDVLFGPQPALLAKCEYQLDDMRRTLAIHYAFFDVQNERSAVVEHPLEFGTDRDEPVHVFSDGNTSIGGPSIVAVRR